MNAKWRLQTRFLFAALLVGMLLMRSPAPIVHAASLTVNTLLDNTTNGDDLCTLREAITAANNNANYNDCTATGYGNDTITFSVSGTITLGSQLPSIADAAGLTIAGPAGGIIISGDNAVRVFQVYTDATLNLQNLTVANGRANSGAGIYNFGTLNITHCTFSGNNSPSTIMGTGGGAINNNGRLTATNCTFSNNSATNTVGGGIFNRNGTLTVNNSTFSGNHAIDGGGVLNDSDATVTNSTFTGNSAAANGGSISNSATGAAAIANSTFSGNSATSSGGGIYNTGTVSVTNSTFSGNSHASLHNTALGTATVYNTIVANSTASGNCSGTITNGGNNIDDETTCGWGNSNGSKSSTNPLLDALADNGGPAQTMALLAGSPAIDGVVYNAPNGCPATDQRGLVRPMGPRCDIGAYERGFLACPSWPRTIPECK